MKTRPHKFKESHVDPDTLLAWIKDQVKEHEDLEVNDVTTSFRDGRVLCAIISHYRPDLLDYSTINFEEPAANNQLAFDLLEKEIGIPPVMTGEEMVAAEVPDFLTMLSYLTLIYDTFRCEIPHIKHPKLVSGAPIEPPKSRPLLPPPPPPPPQPDPVTLRPMKSKFSIVAPREDLGVEELNLTPVKSYEEYVGEDSTMQGDNSKSLVVKISISEMKEPQRFDEILQRNLAELTKTAYVRESRILQEKIDAVLDKNPRKRGRVDAVEMPEVGVQTSNYVALDRKDKSTNLCECCNVNKANFATQVRREELTVTVEDGGRIRVCDFLRCGLGIDPAAVARTKFDAKRHAAKFTSLINMSRTESNDLVVPAEPSFDRVVSWISTSNFDIKNASDSPKTSSVQLDGLTDITSVTRQQQRNPNPVVRPKEIVVEEVDDVVRFNSDGTNAVVCRPGEKGEGASNSAESINKFLEELRNVDSRLKQHFSKPYRRKVRSRSEPPGVFSIIVENEENSIAARSSRQPRSISPTKELPEQKHNETAFTKNHPAIMKASHVVAVGVQSPSAAAVPSTTVHRPSSRHKRHADVHLQTAVQTTAATTTTADRKPRKRKTMEKLSLTNVFLTELTTTIAETVVVGLTLFGLDLLINSNSYGLPTLLF